MLNCQRLAKYDSAGIRHTYDRWPDIAEETYMNGPETIDTDGIEHVIFAGMGGSGSVGNVLAALLSGTDLHVSVIKGYNLPNTTDSRTLTVCCSVSGNTTETLTVARKAASAPCRVILMSNGGLLESLGSKKSIPHYRIQRYHSPRASFVSFLYAALRLLADMIVIPDNHIEQSIAEMRRMQQSINSDNLTGSNSALNLAEWIHDIPVIYYPWGLEAAAIRFKSSLQENTKAHAMAEDVLEASHNGIVAWSVPSDAQPILLQGPDDDIKTQERWRIFEEYFESRDISYRTVRATQGHILTKLVNLVYTLDYTSIYAAVMRGLDPTPVEPIEFIKERSGAR